MTSDKGPKKPESEPVVNDEGMITEEQILAHLQAMQVSPRHEQLHRHTRAQLQKTTILNKEQTSKDSKKYYLFDASKHTLGRLASELTRVLRGKHRVDYTANADCGDWVIVVNAGKIKVTGQKAQKKVYYYHTQYIGGLRAIPYQRMLERKPTEILRLAVKGMMPKTKLSDHQMVRLRIFKDENHGFEAQQPVKIS